MPNSINANLSLRTSCAAPRRQHPLPIRIAQASQSGAPCPWQRLRKPGSRLRHGCRGRRSDTSGTQARGSSRGADSPRPVHLGRAQRRQHSVSCVPHARELCSRTPRLLQPRGPAPTPFRSDNGGCHTPTVDCVSADAVSGSIATITLRVPVYGAGGGRAHAVQAAAGGVNCRSLEETSRWLPGSGISVAGRASSATRTGCLACIRPMALKLVRANPP